MNWAPWPLWSLPLTSTVACSLRTGDPGDVYFGRAPANQTEPAPCQTTDPLVPRFSLCSLSLKFSAESVFPSLLSLSCTLVTFPHHFCKCIFPCGRVCSSVSHRGHLGPPLCVRFYLWLPSSDHPRAVGAACYTRTRTGVHTRTLTHASF